MKRVLPWFFFFKLQLALFMLMCFIGLTIFKAIEETREDLNLVADGLIALNDKATQAQMELAIAEELIEPVVKVKADKFAGTAVAIAVKDGFTYYLTAHHVVDNTSVTFITFDNEVITGVESVASFPEEDLALLRVAGERTCAKIALREPKLYTRVIAVGCPMGALPLPTEGLLTCKEVDAPRTLWEYTAPTIFGNSGGAVFTADGRLIGISNRIVIARVRYSYSPICHLGAFTPLPVIANWLAEVL